MQFLRISKLPPHSVIGHEKTLRIALSNFRDREKSFRTKWFEVLNFDFLDLLLKYIIFGIVILKYCSIVIIFPRIYFFDKNLQNRDFFW